jgi:glucuronoarabinoxylan endo-1,4-beta-xylanase
MKKNLLHYVAFFSLYICQMQSSMQVTAQTVVVGGTVSTSATTVRNASVTFEDKDNPTNVFSAETDSVGQYQVTINLTSVASSTPLPTKFELEQNYPNPFSTSTAIPYQLKSQADIKVTIYDILGRVVWEAAAAAQTTGAHSIFWDGRNARGQKVAPGVYFYSLRAGSESRVRKMVLNGGGDGIPLLAQDYTPPMVRAGQQALQRALAGNFSIRIQNTGTTFPLIASKQIDNVTIQRDTTLNFLVENQNPIPVATVYLDSVLQYIRGFGGANIIPWRDPMTADQVQKAFGAGEGQLGLTILRLRIPYTDNVSEFSAQLAVAQLAQAQGALVFASPWTPPPAMKSNNDIVGGILNPSSYAAYAAHLKAFADYMAINGAPLYAVSVQNEPDASVAYESCSWNAVQLRAFMKNNASAIGTRVMMPESMNFARALSDPTLNDSTAAANTAIIAGHIYGGGLSPYPLAVSKGKEVWMTEHLDLDASWITENVDPVTHDTSYTGALPTGQEIHDCMNAGWNAYLWWYIVRFYGPIDEDGTISKRGYVMSQFARFVRPGNYRIKCNPMPQGKVYVTSYKNDSSLKVVIVALNMSASPVQQTFSVPSGSMVSFTPYTTSQSKNCAQGNTISVTNSSFTATLDPLTITTFVSN